MFSCSAIPDFYQTYLNEYHYDIRMVDDPTPYQEAIASENSTKWIEAMKDELKSMSSNQVWDLVDIPDRVKTVGFKWAYKTKRGSKGNVERLIARLVEKGFTQRERVDYSGTFSPVSKKDSFRIFMMLVAHYDLELHQTDMKTALLNGDLHETAYMAQLEGFVISGKEQMAYKLNKSI
jgi:predicted transcriptional regulator